MNENHRVNDLTKRLIAAFERRFPNYECLVIGVDVSHETLVEVVHEALDFPLVLDVDVQQGEPGEVIVTTPAAAELVDFLALLVTPEVKR